MKQAIFLLLIILLTILIFSFNITALSVVSEYLENNTLLLMDGASKLYTIKLQNPDLEEIQLQLTYDNSTAKVINYEDVYTIAPQSNKAILFNISAPPKSKPNDVYIIGYTVHQLSGSGSGVPLLLKINKSFKVKIIKNPEKSYKSHYYVAYASVALVALSLFLIIYFKKKAFKNRKIIK